MFLLSPQLIEEPNLFNMKGVNNDVKSLSSVYVLRKKFADVVVPLIAAETVFLLYLENIMSY